MGRFFSFSPEDATQLHPLSLPGEKTSLKEAERGAVGGHLDWTGLKEQFSLHEKREPSWTSNSICGRVWASGNYPESLARVAFLERTDRTAMRSGSFKSTGRR